MRYQTLLGILGSLAIALIYFASEQSAIGQACSYPYPNTCTSDAVTTNLRRLAQQTTVRIFTGNASGSGVLVQRQGQTYTVLTSWHVVAFADMPNGTLRERYTIITPDDRRYTPTFNARQLGNTDLAVIQFRSGANYEVAPISREPTVVGEQVFAAGFPMYQPGTLTTTFDRGIGVFRFTAGAVSLLLPKSLSQGYRLGYTNDIAVGMSGGPIFNSNGLLIGINGRVKNRDPDFGVYAFEDGSEPSPAMLQQMVNSSWGIPISTYLQFVSLRSSLGEFARRRINSPINSESPLARWGINSPANSESPLKWTAIFSLADPSDGESIPRLIAKVYLSGLELFPQSSLEDFSY
ncbi:S1 family peptidase [Aerosakkonema funiforme]|uniref:S1 family peptidase n=1 Tax=Aerosakkonema funiforme TaxID=1246630 RepID=UPI0035B78410